MQQGCKSILITSPTGSGKTLLTAFMLKSAAEKKMPCFFIVHRRELIHQSYAAFSSIGLDSSIISAGFTPDYNNLIQICSIQSLARRLNNIQHTPKLIVWDECHHLGARSWEEVKNKFSDSFHVGLTASPCRADGKGLNKYFSQIVHGPSVADLIQAGHLSDYKYYAPPNDLNLNKIHIKMGDYNQQELAVEVDRPKVIGDAIKEYISKSNGKRAIVFCVNVIHSQHTAQMFNAAGIRAEHIDGSDDSQYRSQALDRFRRGETLVLTNVNLFSEGFDLPAIETVIMLRPTKSLSMYLQSVGRGLRPSPGKSHAVIIDHVNNLQEHGLPDDPREWSLDGIKKRESNKSAVKICPKCYAANKQGVSICSYCGQPLFVAKQKKDNDFKMTSDELKEVDRNKNKKKKIDVEKSLARTKDQLTALAIKRGYRSPHYWVHTIMQARQRKKLGV